MNINIKSQGKKNSPAPQMRGGMEDFFLSPGAEAVHDDKFFVGEGELSCDVFQDQGHIFVRAAMAGVDPKNLNISVSNDILTIRGHRESQTEVEESNFYSHEIYWGAFSRSIVLPQEVNQNKVEATLKSGVLTITLPKKYKSTAIKVKHLDD